MYLIERSKAQSSLNDRVSAAIPASKYVKPKAKITVPCLSEIETVRARKIFTSPVIRSWLPWLVLRSLSSRHHGLLGLRNGVTAACLGSLQRSCRPVMCSGGGLICAALAHGCSTNDNFFRRENGVPSDLPSSLISQLGTGNA